MHLEVKIPPMLVRLNERHGASPVDDGTRPSVHNPRSPPPALDAHIGMPLF